MLIGVACSCGEQINVEEIYAGGKVHCPKCGGSVHVDANLVSEQARFRFPCPSCGTRISARKASVGKQSKCPACTRVYTIPKPVEAPDAFANLERRRIEIDDSALNLDEPKTHLPLSAFAPLSVARAPSLEPRPLPVEPVRPTAATSGEMQIHGAEFDGRVIPLSFARYIIGRDKDCDLRLHSSTISRHHCVFKRDEFTLRVRDLGSRNGTYVNGEKIQGDAVLYHEDEVQIGDLTFQILLPHAQPPQRNGHDTDLSISDFVIV